MNANKLRARFLVAVLLAALLFTSACAKQVVFQSADGKALVAQGNAYMYSLEYGNLGEAIEMMSFQVKRPLSRMVKLAGTFVDVENIIKENVAIASWTFDSAHIITRLGSPRGVLDGKVVFFDGTGSKLHLEFDREGGVWKVRSSSMEK
jgi:hypothetical protein